jgi:formylglycine-generating enzyme required for sulfatase activity
MVTLSFEQAQAFCAWLTDSINSTLTNSKLPYAKVIVRLPTKEEWMYAARGGLDSNAIYPWGTTGTRWESGKKKGMLLANYTLDTSEAPYANAPRSLNDDVNITAPVKSYWPNGYGLYNMSGNVAEFVSDGSTKGGSWRSNAHYLRIDAEDFYKDEPAPDPGIGFRYFIEVIEFKPQ